MANRKKTALTREDKFRQCPACFGPIDYFNSCRRCGRGWTPELSETEKLEKAEANHKDGDEEAEEEPALVGERPADLEREKEEILGKKAKLVGTKKKSNLPPAYKHWEILDGDDDVEIIRKRSLMRLDSRKVYNQMGLSMRAYQNLKAVMLSLTRLWGFLDDVEREEFSPTADLLKKGMMGLAEFSAKKVALASAMEEALLREQRKVRTIRAAQHSIKDAIKKRATRVTTPGADTEGLETVDLVGLDPEELMEQVRVQLALKSKKGRYTPDVPEDAPEEEN